MVSLRGLRVQIQKKEDTLKVNKWIVAVLVLHNMVLKFNDNWEEEIIENDEDLNEEFEFVEETGRELRERIKEMILN